MLLAALIAALGLAVLSTSGLIYFARAALVRADGKGASDAKAATLGGEVVAAADKVERANEATDDAAKALEDEKRRSESLEKEADANAASPIVDPWKRLSEADKLERP